MTRIVGFIDEHREEHGVEPICTILSEAEVPIAVSSYYAARSRPVCARTISDAVLDARIRQVHADNYGVYGYRCSPTFAAATTSSTRPGGNTLVSTPIATRSGNRSRSSPTICCPIRAMTQP